MNEFFKKLFRFFFRRVDEQSNANALERNRDITQKVRREISSSANILPALPWITWLYSHLGEEEKTGATPTAFVQAIFKFTNFGALNGTIPPSCAATACAALESTGYASTKSAAALSFASYGSPCELKPGCICVFQWANGEHHVSFCLEYGGMVGRFIGGNQNHHLQISTYETKWIIATRWPVPKT